MISAKLFLPQNEQVIEAGRYEGEFTFEGAFKTDKTIKLLFSSNKYGLVSKTLFPPKGSYPFAGQTVEEAIQRERENNVKDLVSTCVATLELDKFINLAAEDYDTLVNLLIGVLKEGVGKKVTLTFVTNNKGDVILARRNWIEKFE